MHQAELRGLDIIAFTDHNTVAGYAALRQELQNLLLLEELQRIQPDEKYRLDEYRRLLDKILILPGFEFTATFGFHIIGVFPQNLDQRIGTPTPDTECAAGFTQIRQFHNWLNQRCVDSLSRHQ